LLAGEDLLDLNKLRRARSNKMSLDHGRSVARALDHALGRALGRATGYVRSRSRARSRALGRALTRANALHRILDRAIDSELFHTETHIKYWESMLVQPNVYNPLIESLCDIFELKPKAQWWEALRVRFLPEVPQRMKLYKKAIWENVENAFAQDNISDTEVYVAASCLLIDAWMYIYNYYESAN